MTCAPSRAAPKSTSLALRRSSSMMFSGLMSRWQMSWGIGALGHWVIGSLGGWEMGAFEGLPLEAALRQMGQMVIGPSGHWDRG